MTTKALGVLLILTGLIVAIPGIAMFGLGTWVELRFFLGIDQTIVCPDWQLCEHRVVGVIGLLLCSGAVSLMTTGGAKFRIEK
jgi:hypothetical protein